jgi:peptidylprolyl isomerase
VGEKATLYIKPEYGYGASGSPPKIPGNSVLLFDVELLGIDTSTADLSLEEKIREANSKKNTGNEFFKQSKIDQAVADYRSALGFVRDTLQATPEEEKQVTELKVSLHSNLAACLLKLKSGKEAIDECNQVLQLDPSHPKALYRLFQAQVLVGAFDKAIELLNEKKSILGAQVDIPTETIRVQKLKQLELKKEKQMYSKMFQ